MTIPDETIRRAAEAAIPAWFENEDSEDWLSDMKAAVRAALPILRDAIRAELVQEMIDDLDAGSDMVDEQNYNDLRGWLRTFLPESETQP